MYLTLVQNQGGKLVCGELTELGGEQVYNKNSTTSQAGMNKKKLDNFQNWSNISPPSALLIQVGTRANLRSAVIYGAPYYL